MNKKKEKDKHYDIVLTDIQLHTIKLRKPISWHRAVLKSLRNKKPGRFYTKNFNKKEVIFSLSTETQKQIKEAERLGKKIRFFMPREGLPIYPGKDLMEKIESEKRKKKKHKPLTRVWRG